MSDYSCQESSDFRGEGTIDRHVRGQKLGEGTYGVVYKAVDSWTDRFVPMEVFRIGLDGDGIPVTTLREISILHALKHPNIIRSWMCSILATR
jgi:serine/threonine protein kinase